MVHFHYFFNDISGFILLEDGEMIPPTHTIYGRCFLVTPQAVAILSYHPWLCFIFQHKQLNSIILLL